MESAHGRYERARMDQLWSRRVQSLAACAVPMAVVVPPSSLPLKPATRTTARSIMIRTQGVTFAMERELSRRPDIRPTRVRRITGCTVDLRLGQPGGYGVNASAYAAFPKASLGGRSRLPRHRALRPAVRALDASCSRGVGVRR